MTQKWIKQPNPGQFRGVGEWLKLEDSAYTEADWDRCAGTGFLPTAEQDEKPVT